jgi:hypothetical protein
MHLMFNDGIVHVIERRETIMVYGRLQCGKLFSLDTSSRLPHRKAEIVQGHATCIRCLSGIEEVF